MIEHDYIPRRILLFTTNVMATMAAARKKNIILDKICVKRKMFRYITRHNNIYTCIIYYTIILLYFFL